MRDYELMLSGGTTVRCAGESWQDAARQAAAVAGRPVVAWRALYPSHMVDRINAVAVN